MPSTQEKNANKKPTRVTTPLPIKFVPPHEQAGYIERLHIAELVIRSPVAKVFLYSAPAGFGKTAAMLQHYKHLQKKEVATLWVNVTDDDNNTANFSDTVNDALQLLLATDERQQLTDSLSWTESLELLSKAQRPFAIFFDDLEHIDNPAALKLIQYLIRHMPANGQIAIATRNTLDLDLSRLRAYRQLVDIDVVVLQFTPEETHSFLCARHGATLDALDVENLHDKMGGWAAGLQLASLSLSLNHNSKRAIVEFSGSNSTVTDFLVHEVFAHVPEDLRNFMIQTCILDELSGPLCDTLTLRRDSDALLAKIFRAGLFLIPVDCQLTRYKFHRMFRDFLRSQLQQRNPEEVLRLHRLAAEWHHKIGDDRNAVEHALLSKDLSLIRRLLTCYVPMAVKEFRFDLLAHWYAHVPPELLKERSVVSVCFTAALSMCGRYKEATKLAKDVWRESHSDPEPTIDFWWSFIEYCKYIARDIPLRSLPRAKRATRRHPESRSFMFFIHGLVLYQRGDLERSQERFERCKAHMQRRSVTPLVPILAANREVAKIEITRGNLHIASAIVKSSIEHKGISQNNILIVSSKILLASIQHQWNDIAESHQLIRDNLSRCVDYGYPDCLINAFITGARNAHLQRLRDRCLDLLVELENIGIRKSLPRIVASAWLELARIATDNHDFDAARNYLARIQRKNMWSQFESIVLSPHELHDPTIAEIRLLVRSGKSARALAMIDTHLGAAQETERLQRALKLNILKAIALQATQNAGPAVQLIEDALRFAARNHHIRAFADEDCAELTALLEATRNRLSARRGNDLVANRMTTFTESVQTAIRSQNGLLAGEPDTTTPHHDLPLPITKGELRVLRCMAQGLSNAAIAKQLFLSQATINAHLRNINTKLKVNNRVQAIAIARKNGWIED